MATGPYIPRNDKARVSWLNNFAAQFATLAAQFGFTPADVTAVNGYAAMFDYLRTFAKKILLVQCLIKYFYMFAFLSKKNK